MLQRFLKPVSIWLLLVSVVPGWAFTLIGPYNPAWQVDPLGYNGSGLNAQVNIAAPGVAIGGPMNLDEEYRINAPTFYYGIDRTFLDYFGERGAEEIDKAVKILNELPASSSINIDDYPLKSERINSQARALGLIDLKSFALMSLVRHLGLTSPTHYVFTTRQRIVTATPTTNYIIIKRNFDPVTWRPTSYINGDLWTYSGIVDNQNVPTTFPINVRVDPLANGFPVADLLGGGSAEFTAGSYFTGLTRDDVGGLKYIYRPENLNVENAVTNTFGLSAPIAVSGGGGNPGSPWVGIPIGSTNAAGGGGIQVGGPGGPWTPVFIPQVSTNGGGAVTPTNIVGTIATNAFVVTALRGGVDKINLIKVEFDSLLGQFIAPIIDSFADSIVTNKVKLSQTLGRVVAAPDLLFNASDLFNGGQVGAITVFGNGLVNLIATQGWDNNVTLNGGGPSDSGPGVIQPGMVITFNKSGPAFVNGPFPSNLSEPGALGVLSVVWGAFDGTTNAPVVFPNNVSIQDLERQVFGQ